jgi:prophage regulatory protein
MPTDLVAPLLLVSPAPEGPVALLLSDVEAAALLGICRASLHRLRASGKVPLPVKLGRSVRWDRRELEKWIEAGAPALELWQAMKAANARRMRS